MRCLRFFTLAFLLLILASASFGNEFPQPQYVKGKTLSVSQFDQETQLATIKILSGKFKGGLVEIEHITSSMMGGDMILKAGDKVMLYVDEAPSKAESPDGSPIFNIADYSRSTPLYWLAFFYALLLIVIGGIKGLRSLLSLLLTIGLIFLVLFPLTLWGFNPLLVAIVISGIVSLLSFRIIGGKTVKTISASIGTLVGVAIAGLIALFVGKMVHLSGLSSEEAKILLYSMEVKINYQGLLFGSILIGALGAVMDVGMSIASSIDEIHKVHPKANFQNLFKAGMNVGRDVMGTMSNTLILAYTGASLPLLLLMVANNVSFAKIINLEMIATEIIRALAGSIGLVLCIPITAAVAALLHHEKGGT
ncbi:MAG: YibE/F family protein [bacterium]|nr:YibE/F family protein [Candidatus Margulisiibacteriota bacterium]